MKNWKKGRLDNWYQFLRMCIQRLILSYVNYTQKLKKYLNLKCIKNKKRKNILG